MFQTKTLTRLAVATVFCAAIVVMADCANENNSRSVYSGNSENGLWSCEKDGLRMRLTIDNTRWTLLQDQHKDQPCKAIAAIRADFTNLGRMPVRLARLAPHMVQIRTASGIPAKIVPHMLGWLCRPVSEADFPEIGPGQSATMTLNICPGSNNSEAMIYDPSGSCATSPIWFSLSSGRYGLKIVYANTHVVQKIQDVWAQGFWIGKIDSSSIPILVAGD